MAVFLYAERRGVKLDFLLDHRNREGEQPKSIPVRQVSAGNVALRKHFRPGCLAAVGRQSAGLLPRPSESFKRQAGKAQVFQEQRAALPCSSKAPGEV